MASNPQHSMSSPSPLVWFLLLDSATGQLYKGTSASSVLCSSLAVPVVDQFRDSVKAKHSNKLSSVDAADLLVYKNKAAFDKRNAAVDEGKEEPLEEDSLIDGFGTSKKEALIVVVPLSAGSSFRGDEMEFDSSSTTFDSSRVFVNTKIDGIALGTEHLKRNELIGKLQLLVSKNSTVLLSSPAASGKSSLYKLYRAANKNVEVLGISFMDERTPFALLSEAGIDLQQKKISKILAKKEVVVFLDDAQKKYGEGPFWETLVKALDYGCQKISNSLFLPLIHYLEGKKVLSNL